MLKMTITSLIDFLRKSELSLTQLPPNGVVATFFCATSTAKLRFARYLINIIPNTNRLNDRSILRIRITSICISLKPNTIKLKEAVHAGEHKAKPINFNRPVSKHSFEETGRLKKVATAPLGASCPNDNSDFRNKSNDVLDLH